VAGDRNRMDPRTATREQYLNMKARAIKAALTVEAQPDAEMEAIVAGIGKWASEWVREWEDAHPGQAEHRF
jgi:hypothetical protein